MARPALTFAAVRDLALDLPGVEESTAYGSPALKLGGKLLACVPSNRSAEPGSLVVSVDFPDRAELLASAPEIYYITPHYEGHPSVLVRLSRLDRAALRDLLRMSHKFVASTVRLRTSSRRAPRVPR